MSTVTRSALEHILRAHPNAKVTVRDGAEVVVIPTYDINTDEAGEMVKRIVDDPKPGKPKPGDLMQDTKSGATFKIVDPPGQGPKLRKGPKADL